MKKKCLAIGIILLFGGTCIIPAIAQDTEIPLPTSKGNWLYVGGSGPGNYTHIQDAIDNASDGDTVFVFDGTYYETIVVDKMITLMGENKNTTIIDGINKNDSVIVIKSNEVNVRGFTIRNSSTYHYSIFLRVNHYGACIIDNIFKNNNGGISIQGSYNTNVSRNIIINSSGDAIALINSSNNTVDRNIILQTRGNSSSSISITGNSNDNNIISNTINQSSISGIDIVSSNHNKISNNNINNCEVGIYLSNTFSNEVSSNTISNNKWGFFLVWYAEDNIINNNTISKNTNGIEIKATRNNTIYHNNFLNNTCHASVNNGNNKWDNGYPSCGNYWDDYTGDDVFWGSNQDINGSDGVGDTHRVIYGGTTNRDNYPLMVSFKMTYLSFSFYGGFGLNGKIKNVGNNTAFQVCWEVTWVGGIILFGRETLRVVPKPLLPGEEAIVKAKMILGFGKTTSRMMLWADNAPHVLRNYTAYVLLFFILGLLSGNRCGLIHK